MFTYKELALKLSAIVWSTHPVLSAGVKAGLSAGVEASMCAAAALNVEISSIKNPPVIASTGEASREPMMGKGVAANCDPGLRREPPRLWKAVKEADRLEHGRKREKNQR